MGDVSPLFVVEAEQMMLAEMYEEAIQLCEEGLAEYPEYVTAWTIIVKSHQLNENAEEAERCLAEASTLFPEYKFNISFDETSDAASEKGKVKSEKLEEAQTDEDTIQVDSEKEKLEEIDNEDENLQPATGNGEPETDNEFSHSERSKESNSTNNEEEKPEQVIEETEEGDLQPSTSNFKPEDSEEIKEEGDTSAHFDSAQQAPLSDRDEELESITNYELGNTNEEEDSLVEDEEISLKEAQEIEPEQDEVAVVENEEETTSSEETDNEEPESITNYELGITNEEDSLIDKEELIIDTEENEEEDLHSEETENGKRKTENDSEQPPTSDIESIAGQLINKLDTIVRDNITSENITIDETQKLEQGFLIQYFSDKPKQVNFPELTDLINDLAHHSIEEELYERTSFRDVVVPENFLNDISFKTALQFTVEEEPSIPEAFEDTLSELAKKLDSASIPTADELEKPLIHKSSKSHKSTIVSETMADIYLQQGAYEAAAEAYKELLIKNPDKKDYFMKKLDNLTSKMK